MKDIIRNDVSKMTAYLENCVNDSKSSCDQSYKSISMWLSQCIRKHTVLNLELDLSNKFNTFVDKSQLKVKEKCETPSAKSRVEMQKKNPSPYGGIASSVNRNSMNRNVNSRVYMKGTNNPPPPPRPMQTPQIPSSTNSSLSKSNAVRPIGYMAKEYGNRGLKGISGKGSMSEGISKDDIKRPISPRILPDQSVLTKLQKEDKEELKKLEEEENEKKRRLRNTPYSLGANSPLRTENAQKFDFSQGSPLNNLNKSQNSVASKEQTPSKLQNSVSVVSKGQTSSQPLKPPLSKELSSSANHPLSLSSDDRSVMKTSSNNQSGAKLENPEIIQGEIDNWFESPKLSIYLERQRIVDPSWIFDDITTCDLKEMFPHNHNIAGTRGSSANWD